MASPKAARAAGKRAAVTKTPPQSLGVQAPLTCPVCEQAFLGSLPPPAILEGHESDLRPLFSGAGAIDPLAMLIQVCPHCHFAAYPQSFGHRGELLDELFEQCTSAPGDRPPPLLLGDIHHEETCADLRRFLQREELPGGLKTPAQRYLHAARCHDYVSAEEASLLADYFLRASWVARGHGDARQESACRAEAIQRLWPLIDDELQPTADKVRTIFLLGELSRRQGDFANAIDLFTQLEDFSSEPNDQGEQEIGYFCVQAQRLLPLACMKSEINARLWDFDEGEGEDDGGEAPDPQALT